MLGVGAVLLLLYARSDWSVFWVDVFWVLVVGATGVKCVDTTRALRGHERRGWLCISVACLAYLISECLWSFYELILDISLPVPSPADIGYAASPLLLMVGIWLYRTKTLTLDAALVQLGNFGIIIAASFVANLILFRDSIGASGGDGRVLAVIAFVVIASSAFVFVLFNVWFYLSGRRRFVMTPLLLGVGALAASDYLTSVEFIAGTFASTALSNWGYILAFGFIYWAAFEQDVLTASAPVDAPPLELADRARQWETLLPPVVTLGVLALAIVHVDDLDPVLVFYGSGAALLFVVPLGVRDWWSHRIEVRLREQGKAGEERLQESAARLTAKNEELASANRELRDEMKMRIRAQEELRQSQKMEALGHLTGGVAHDFNNLLAVVLGNLELLSYRLDPEGEEQAYANEASAAAERGAALTRRLLAFSRKQPLAPQPVEVGTLLEGMRGLLESTVSEAIRVEIRVQEDLWYCMADPAQLENSILNLAINARDAMRSGGNLALEVSNLTIDEDRASTQSDIEAGSFVAITVRDSGVGIPTDVLSRVFDPFFTTKEVGAGSGLGLSMVYGFARQSGGHVSIHSEEDMGTEVRIILPKTDASATSSDLADPDVIPRGDGESVLLVEDESAVRKLIVSFLEDLNYVVAEVGNGSEALAILHEENHFDLLLSDVVLPGVYSGADLAREVIRRRPGVKVLLMSGYATDVRDREDLAGRDFALLHKPFKKGDLARRLRAILGAEGSL